MPSSPDVLLDVKTPHHSRRHVCIPSPMPPRYDHRSGSDTCNNNHEDNNNNNNNNRATEIFNGSNALQQAFETGRMIALQTSANSAHSTAQQISHSSLSRQLHLVEAQRDTLVSQVDQLRRDLEIQSEEHLAAMHNRENNVNEFEEQVCWFCLLRVASCELRVVRSLYIYILGRQKSISGLQNIFFLPSRKCRSKCFSAESVVKKSRS